MIIELPVLTKHTGAVRRYRMGFFHFSNNNLAIRRQCAIEVGGYDPTVRTSEDVDICFRVAQSGAWVACREPGVMVQHKARRTVRAMMKQLWGWGINLGRVYRKTGIEGAYLYWVSFREQTITGAVEWPLPGLFLSFLTSFHLAHIVLAVALVAALLGATLPAVAFAVAGALLLVPFLRTLTGRQLGVWRTIKLAAVTWLANATFMTAAFVGGLRARMLLVPAPMFPTRPPIANASSNGARA